MKGIQQVSDNFKKTLSLFCTFFKIGAFTFGGGYAMIPLIQREISEKKKWITNDDILDVIAIAESTPGPIAINSATFVGYKVCGFAGAFFSTLGIVLPSFVIITVISYFLDQFQHILAVKYAFNGIRVGVTVLIIRALISMYKQCPKNLTAYIIMGLSFVFVAFFKANIMLVLILCAVTGIVSSYVAMRRQKNDLS